MDARNTQTTRYLCAAAYLDPQFRETVIRGTLEEEHKAIGENYGVDLPLVVNYALAARRREVLRDGWLMVPWLFVFLLIIGVPAALLSANRLALFVGALIVAWLIIFGFLWHDYFRVIVPNLMTHRSGGGGLRSPGTSDVPGLQELSGSQSGNVVVYSGFSPFVGAGRPIGGWSFAVNTAKGKEEMGRRLPPIPFRLGELYHEIFSSLGALRIPGLIVEPRLHVDGAAIRNDTRFLPNPESRPYPRVDPSLVAAIAERPEDTVRHYVCVRVVSWQGELVVSLFTRFVQLDDKLFIEANYFLLPPIHDKYRAIDELPTLPAWRKTGGLLAQAAWLIIPLWPTAPIRLLGAAARPLERSGRRQRALRTIREGQNFDYGATTTLREIAASTSYRRFFEMLDKEMYVKITQRHLLETIIAFLDRKNIDTTDFNEQRNTILNNGVMVSGGSITAESLAVGERAQAGVAVAPEAVGTVRPTGGVSAGASAS